MSTTKRVIHIAQVTDDFTSGVSNVVPNYIKYEKQIYNEVELINLNNVKLSDAINRLLCSAGLNNSVVVFHEIYRVPLFLLASVCRFSNIDYFVVPHGSLTRQAQTQRAIVKKCINLLFVNKYVSKARGVHFLSNRECEESIRFKAKDRFIIPNGVEIPNCYATNRNENIKRIVFIGRLDIFVKGLDLLIESAALAQNQIRANAATIEMYGPSYNGSAKKLADEIQKKGIADILQLKGPLAPENKKQVLSNAYCYIQLSRTEGFPTSVIEAMSFGLPVIVTEGTTWKDEVLAKNLGFGVNGEPIKIAEAITALLSNDELHDTMAQNARTLAKANYSWETIAKAQLKHYAAFNDFCL